MLENLDTESSIFYFYSVINSLIQLHVPHRFVKSRNGYPPWFSRSLIKIIRDKKKIHKRWKIYGNPLDEAEFKLLRKREHKLEPECYRNFISMAENKIFHSPKHLWSFVNSKFPVNGIPEYMSYNGATSNNGQVISNMFNEYFNSVFVMDSDGDIPLDDICDTPIDLSSVLFSEELVFELLKRVDVGKGGGMDLIHPLFIVRCARELTVPLTKIFKVSMSEGHFPAIWKSALVTPIHKSHDAHQVTNYRPISKLNIFANFFEKIVTNAITSSCCQHVSTVQHGFYRGRGVDTNVLTFTDFILNRIDAGWQVDAVYTDFSKAFDKINHRHLIYKIKRLGIHGDLLRWLESYILNRSQAVCLKGFTSRFLPVASGVPQGSHLGPLLFILYINDMNTCFQSSKVLIYADDTKIYKAIASHTDCQDMQTELGRFYEYCNANHLYLNLDKCYCISFTRKKNPIFFDYTVAGIIIKRVSTIRDLGIILDTKLSFIPHIDYICKKAFKNLGMILRIGKPFRRPVTYKLLFFAYVRSVLEFGSIIWSPIYKVHIDRIERIQNIFLKALCCRTGVIFNSPIESANFYNILSLQNRRLYLDSLFFFKILKDIIKCPNLLQNIVFNIPHPSLRSRDLFHISFARTNYSQHAFFRRVSKFYNQRLGDIDPFSSSLNYFKAKLRTKL